MKHFIGGLIIALGIIGGLYVGGWIFFAQPIIEACKQFDLGTLNASVIGMTIMKCAFAGLIGTTIGTLGMIIGALFFND